MEKVPKIVGDRLTATTAAVEHPDADVLNAFSERSLTQPERVIVLEHLARCGECREIVALALPPTEGTQMVTSPAKSGWLTWPVLRWGLIAAGMVAIASFGVLQYQRQHSSPTMIAYKAAAEPLGKEARRVPSSASAERDKSQNPADTERVDQPARNAGPSAASNMTSPGTPSPSRAGAVGGVLQHGPRVQWQQNAQNQALTSPLSLPPAKQVHGNAASPGQSQLAQAHGISPSAGSQSSDLDGAVPQGQQVGQRPELAFADSRVEKTKPAATEAAAPPVPSSPGQKLATAGPTNGRSMAQMAQLVAVAPASLVAWNISPSGVLQRSFDQGSTWQNVDVAGSAAGHELSSANRTSRAKEVFTDNLKKEDESTPVFRAVASNGTDVWAGAANGLLYHSTDAGNHWIRVVPSASGATLAGDINSLEFIDPQHGRIVTSTSEIWITSDAGRTWRKQ